MAITVQCPHCKKVHQVHEDLAGTRVTCGCGKRFDVPAGKTFGDFVSEELAAAPPPEVVPPRPAQVWWNPFPNLSPAARRKVNMFISVVGVLLPLLLIGSVFYVMANRTNPGSQPFRMPAPPTAPGPTKPGETSRVPQPGGLHATKNTAKPVVAPPPPSVLADTIGTLKKQGAKFKTDKSGAIIDVDYSAAVDEHAADFDESMLAVLDKIPTLKSLNLTDTPLGDFGLERLKGLSELTRLNLSNTRITDQGLRHLANLASLTTITIERSQISGKGVEAWTKLTSLSDLTLNNSQITDAGLAAIGKLTTLTSLQLDGCKELSNSGLEHLKGLTKLNLLDLSHTRVSDPGAVHLANLTDLRSLILSGCLGIGDDALKELSALSNLKQLDLQNTLTSNKAIDKLRPSMPGCKINR